MEVAPLAGAWIEILRGKVCGVIMREVAPLAGAWIEMALREHGYAVHRVAPLAGAWIEMPPFAPIALRL